MRYIYYVLFSIVLLSCKKTETILAPNLSGSTRLYYVQAEIVEWNYLPLGYNNSTPDHTFSSNDSVYISAASNRIGTKYLKALYVEYTDSSFTTKKPKESDDLGILGPVFRGEVGDSLWVYFRNKTPFSLSIHPHGVKYDKINEGISPVLSNASFTYKWYLDSNSLPSSNDESSLGWLYHSHVHENENQDVYTGLVGNLVTYRKGYLVNNKDKNVDVEKFAIFSILDENQSLLIDSNLKKYLPKFTNVLDPDYIESNVKHAVNGYLYANAVFKNIKQNSKVRWFVSAIGDFDDVHALHWHGNTVEFLKSRTDVILVGPANLYTATMKASNPGEFLFHCHVDEHFLSGMISSYQVTP